MQLLANTKLKTVLIHTVLFVASQQQYLPQPNVHIFMKYIIIKILKTLCRMMLVVLQLKHFRAIPIMVLFKTQNVSNKIYSYKYTFLM